MMNTQKAAKWFGYILLIVGILGFIPGVVTGSGLLLWYFPSGCDAQSYSYY